MLRLRLPILLASFLPILSSGQDKGVVADTIPAAEIMKRVAENQDREQKERESFIYEEHIRVATRFKNGKLAREEEADYLVTPTAKGTVRNRTAVKGRYSRKGRYIDFKGKPVPEADSLDGGLVSGFRDDLLENKSKDSMGSDLFPLTSEGQKNLRFEKTGAIVVNGRTAYRIRFRPSDKNDFG